LEKEQIQKSAPSPNLLFSPKWREYANSSEYERTGSGGHAGRGHASGGHASGGHASGGHASGGHASGGHASRAWTDQRPYPHPNHALTTPIVQTATYTFSNTADLCDFMEAKIFGGNGDRGEYGRYGNPTVRAVEKRIAALEQGEDALLFPTGMSAITNVILSILPTDSHVIFTDDCYRKTRQFCNTFLTRLGIETSQVPMGDYEAMETAVQPNTRLIISESPTNPYLRVADLRKDCGHCPQPAPYKNDHRRHLCHPHQPKSARIWHRSGDSQRHQISGRP
jgi:hypothetical protein